MTLTNPVFVDTNSAKKNSVYFPLFKKQEGKWINPRTRVRAQISCDRRWKNDNRKTLSRDLAANENEDKGCFQQYWFKIRFKVGKEKKRVEQRRHHFVAMETASLLLLSRHTWKTAGLLNREMGIYLFRPAALTFFQYAYASQFFKYLSCSAAGSLK